MRYTKSDIRVAFTEIGGYLLTGVMWVARTTALVLAGAGIMLVAGWLLVNYFAYFVVTIVVLALGWWVYISLETAKTIREYDEWCSQFQFEKSKPTHNKSNVL